MGMTVGTRNNVTTIEFTNKDGSLAGTLTVSTPRKNNSTKKTSKSNQKKRKKLQYNSKRLSNQIMQSKTSVSAKQLTTKTKFQIIDLRRKLSSGDYNYVEVHNALKHAEKIARVAKKRLKNLQQEENIEKLNRMTDAEDMELQREDEDQEFIDTTAMSEEELKKLAQELQEEMERIEDELEEAMNAEDLMEQFVQGGSHEMEPNDLELLKKKHRADELRDIMKADMEYLKALFDQYAREKQEAESGMSNLNDSSDSSGQISGVMLELGGVDIPVEASTAPLEVAGAVVDAMA